MAGFVNPGTPIGMTVPGTQTYNPITQTYSTGTTIGQSSSDFVVPPAPAEKPVTPTPTGDPNDTNGNGIPDWYENQIKAQNDARRTSAFDELNAVFREYGIDMDGSGLAAQVRSWVFDDKSADWVRLEIRKTDAYNQRFTGMADLIKRGQFMSEAEYIQQERSYRNVMAQWDIPSGFYDDPTDFGRFIANGVSVKELDDRIKSGKTFLDTQTDSAYRQALNALGISDGALLAHILDGDRAQSVIQREMKAAALGGAANKYGFGLDAAQMDQYGSTLGDQYNGIGIDQRQQLESTLSQLGQQADQDQKLSTIDNEAFKRTDVLDASLMNDSGKQLASKRRADREAARFSGSSGFTSASLSSKGSF